MYYVVFENLPSALAEAGIIPSNLSGGNLDEDREGLSFSPDRQAFIFFVKSLLLRNF